MNVSQRDYTYNLRFCYSAKPVFLKNARFGLMGLLFIVEFCKFQLYCDRGLASLIWLVEAIAKNCLFKFNEGFNPFHHSFRCACATHTMQETFNTADERFSRIVGAW